MVVRNKIWEELKQAHANVLCILWYNNRQRKCERWYQMFISITASAGTFGFLFNDLAPLYSSLAIAFVSIVKSLYPQFLQPEKELCILDELMDYYNEYMVEMECLFYKFDHDKMTEDETFDEMYNLKKTECAKFSMLNKFVRSIPEKRKKKIENDSTEYINRVYFNKYESDESKQ